MKILDKIKSFFVKEEKEFERPTHPADTYLLLKEQIREQFDLEPHVDIHIHDRKDEESQEIKREQDWKMVNFVEEMAELWDLKVTTSEIPAVKTNFDYGNGITAFTNYSADDYFEYKSKEEE